MLLDTTIGGPNANSYADLDFFNNYASARFPVIAWFTTAPDAMKIAYLIAACRDLDACFEWTGKAVDPLQARAWPRMGMMSRNKYVIPTTGSFSLPVDLKSAQCEFALQLGIADRLVDNVPIHKGITNIKAGTVGLSFSDVIGKHQTAESADVTVRKQQSDLNYISDVVPDEVRRLLVGSWFTQNLTSLPLIFNAFGGDGHHRHGGHDH